MDFALYEAPRGIQGYIIGKCDTLQPNRLDKLATLGTSFIGTNFDFPKFTSPTNKRGYMQIDFQLILCIPN